MSAAEEALLGALRERFGHPGFREGQQQVIRSVLEGRPTVAIMPTGAGKSLCYQLPALLLPGVTLVISPLIALMKDQVDALAARGIPATFINSSLPETEREARASAMSRGEVRLVYVAPERFRSPRFLESLRRTPVALFAVDEAHCISLWGHDFRPDYARLGEVRQSLGAARTLALTATATAAVRADICRALKLQSPVIHVAGFDRPNLLLEVTPVRSGQDKLACLQRVVQGAGSGIVYCATRKSVTRVALALQARGTAAFCYHAGLGDPERQRAHEAFRRPGAVVVATNAFGMGVDKPDLRFVAHFELPRSVEAYYQEIGRAGRDGEPARAALLFNHADVARQERLIELSHPRELLVRDLWEQVRQRPVVQQTLQRLAALTGSSEQEVAAALRLLEQAGHLERGAQGEGPVLIGLLRPAATIALPARAVVQRTALEAIVSAVGEGEPREVFLAELATRAGLTVEAMRRAVTALASAGALLYRPAFGGRVIRVLEPSLPPDQLRVNHPLVRWREDRAKALLRAMSGYVYGRGCRRRYLLAHFGERAPFRCQGCDVCLGRRVPVGGGGTRSPRQRREKRKAGEPSTREQTLALFQKGLSVERIARERRLSAETVRGHLADLLVEGHRIDLRRIIEAERLELMLEVADIAVPSVQALKRALPPDYQFGEIALVLAARRAGRLPPSGKGPPDDAQGSGDPRGGYEEGEPSG